MKNSQRRRIHLLVVALYALLAVILTWPLVRHLATHVPGSYTWAFDEYTFLWNSWWFRYAALDLGQNPLHSSHIFYPVGIDLVLYTYNLFNAFLSVPLQPFLSLPAINNLTFLFATVSSGYGTFLLVKYLLSNIQYPISGMEKNGYWILDIGYWAAFLAGVIYAFGSYRLVYAAIGHYDLWSNQWIPFYTLFLLKTIHNRRLRYALLAGLLLVFILLCETSLGVFAALLSLVILAFALTKRRRADIAGGPAALLGRLVVLGLVVVILFGPVLLPVLREMFGGYELAGWGDAEKLSADLVGLVTPPALHPLGGDWETTLRQTREGTARFRDVNTVFLGWAGLSLAVVGAVRYRRRLAAWITSAVLFAILSLGPLLQINGRSTFSLDGLETTVPLPFILLHYIPIVKANRVPNRFSVVLMLALAVLAGFGAYWLLSKAASRKLQATGRLRATGLLLVTCCLLLFEHWSVPLPLTDARIPEVYQQVAAEPGDFAILQLPLGWRNSFGVQGAESTQAQYYQTFHHKRLLSGNISRNPPFKFDYFRRQPILESLITLQTYGQVDAERRAADQAIAGEFVRFYDLRYVVVAPGVAGRPPYVDTRDEAVAYVEAVLPVTQIYNRDGWLLYHIDQAPASGALALDIGASVPLAAMALAEGWSHPEEIQGRAAAWAVDQGARVLLPATGATDHRLALTALPFDYPDAATQQIALSVNGHRFEPVSMQGGWADYAWEVPGRFLHQGLNDVRLEFERLDAPADVLPGSANIGGSGVAAPIAIEVNSGGPAGFAYITVGDASTVGEGEDGSVHRPGYNVAVIHPKTGKLLDRRGFDTTPGGSEAEAAALADFIASVPPGHIVVVAVQGEGAAHLTDEAVTALHTLGGQVDPRGTTGWSHAIIGVKWATSGTALEAAGPAGGWLRVAPDRRTLAIAVDAIHWESTSAAE